ncbi:MAG: hypothetical protein LBR81_06930 [Prevotellaceae bacterium]|jgi:hypothetical protein|nr:hypothetical protein [Prevotellaceae bacterium]
MENTQQKSHKKSIFYKKIKLLITILLPLEMQSINHFPCSYLIYFIQNSEKNEKIKTNIKKSFYLCPDKTMGEAENPKSRQIKNFM